MNNKQILISRVENIPPIFLEDFESTLRSSGVEISSEARPNAPFAALEDYIPTAIVILIAKPFFEAFLKKAGEDAYAEVKKAFGRLIALSKKVGVTIVASGPKKTDPNYASSRVVSILCSTKHGQKLKLLIPQEIPDADVPKLVDSIFEILSDNFSDKTNDTLTELLLHERKSPLHILHYNQSLRQWAVKIPTQHTI